MSAVPQTPDVQALQDELNTLRHREELFRTIATASPVPITITKIATGEALFTNQVLDDLFNDGKSLVGAASIDFYDDPEDRPRMLAKLQSEGKLLGEHLVMRHSDGSRADYLMYLIPAVVHGTPVINGYCLNVTAQKTAERALQTRNREMQQILAHVNDGLVMLDAQSRLSTERSRAVTTWFGPPVAGETFADLARRVDPSFAEWFELAWEAVEDGILPLALSIDQLPSLLRAGERYIQVTYSPVHSDEARPEGVPNGVLAVMKDITDAVERERAEAVSRELLQLFDRLLRDRASVAEFHKEASSIVAELSAPGLERTRATRLVHTLKGNCALFGLTSLVELCHAVESEAKETRAGPSASGITRIASAWHAIATKCDAFLQAGAENAVELDHEDVTALHDALEAGAPHAALLALVHGWRHEPTRRRLKRIAGHITALATRLGKGVVDVQVAAGPWRLDPARWAPFWSAFAHAVRNAVDHGLETPAERAALGKGTARVRLRTEADAKRFVLTLADDGRGIDWSAVRAKAVQVGMDVDTPDGLQRALFTDGLSTKTEATAVSGRGVGMGALLAETKALGGRIMLRSTPGKGTTFQFVFPLSAMA